jgi:hypothetical protein
MQRINKKTITIKDVFLLPDPTEIKIPVLSLMIFDWLLLMPLSHFGHLPLLLP